MEIDLALRGLDEAEAARVVDHAHRAVQRHHVVFTLPPRSRTWSSSWRTAARKASRIAT